MKIVAVILWGVLVVNEVFAQLHSLTTKFSDVVLSNMKPGMVYSLKKEKGIPFTVINNTKKKRLVEVTIAVPTKSQLEEHYKPIPDVAWVSVVPSKFELGPGEKMDCDVIISIPPDERYANRHFLAVIVTKSISPAGPASGYGVAVNLALASKIKFSTGLRPEKIIEEHRRKIFSALRLEISPLSLFIRDEVPVGKKVVLGKDFDTVQLVNKSNKKHKVSFSLAKRPGNYGLVSGYEPLPPEIKVKFKKILWQKLRFCCCW